MTCKMLTSCTICNALMSSTALDFHRSQHDSLGRPFKCLRGCIKTYFATFDERQMHMTYLHGNDDYDVKPRLHEMIDIKSANLTELPIDYCSRSSSTSSRSTNDSDVKPCLASSPSASTRCTFCDRVIAHSNMTSHMRLHTRTDRRPHECVLGCRSTYFPTEQALAQHSRTMHNVRKSTTCTVCHIHLNGDVPRHMETHDSSKPFQCPDGCVQRFFANDKTFLRHRRQVHNVKNDVREQTIISCAVCGRTALEKHMKLHMKMHQSEGRVPCTDGCVQLYFSTELALRKHQTSVHKATLQSRILNDSVTAKNIPSKTPALEKTSIHLQVITDTKKLLKVLCPSNDTHIKKTIKKPTGTRSIRNTPTVQMQIKMEPVSPPPKRARFEVRPPSPPVYGQLYNQNSDNGKPKPPSLTVLPDVDSASGSRLSAMPSVSLSRSLINKDTNRTRLPSFYLSDVDHDHDYAEKTLIESSAGEISSAYSPSSNNSDSRWSPVKRQRRLKQRVRQPRRRKRAPSTSSDDSNADDDYHDTANEANDDDVENSFIDNAGVSDSSKDSDSDSDSESSFIGRKVKSRLRELKRQIINLQSTASRKEQAN